jgi:hypothetical protein
VKMCEISQHFTPYVDVRGRMQRQELQKQQRPPASAFMNCIRNFCTSKGRAMKFGGPTVEYPKTCFAENEWDRSTIVDMAAFAS